MKVFFKNSNLFFLLVLILFSCGKKENIYLFPTWYRLPSYALIQQLRVETKTDDEIKVLKAKLWFKKNKARIEIMKDDSKAKKIIIMDEKNLYLIDENSKTAYKCRRDSDFALGFLSDVIINAGIGRTDEKIAGTEKVLKKDCIVYYYNIFVQQKGFFCPALIKEYREKLNDNVVKIISEITPHYSENKKIIKTMEIIKTHNMIFLSDKLFKTKQDIRIIELKNLPK